MKTVKNYLNRTDNETLLNQITIVAVLTALFIVIAINLLTHGTPNY